MLYCILRWFGGVCFLYAFPSPSAQARKESEGAQPENQNSKIKATVHFVELM
jgi:hypothetical protein